jgi:hypothetical protein
MGVRKPSHQANRVTEGVTPELKPERDAALFLGAAVRTLQRWRQEGGGPPFYKVGRKVLYHQADLSAWLADCRRVFTTEAGAGRLEMKASASSRACTARTTPRER